MPPSPRTISYINLAAFIALVLINALSNIPSSSASATSSSPSFHSPPATNLLGTTPIGTVSNAYPTPITPAGYTFSIWGLIYVCLGVYVLAQCIYPEWLALAHTPSASSASATSPVFRAILPYLFAASCVFNIVWILVFTQLPVHKTAGTSGLPLAIVSTIVLVALAGCVYGWMAELAQVVARGGSGSVTDYVFGTVALLGAILYCAWTTIACVLNVWTCISSARGGEVANDTTGAMVTLGLLAVGFCGLLAWSRRNAFPPHAPWARVAFAAVFVWAVIGVLVSRKEAAREEGVRWVGGLGALGVGVVGVWSGYGRTRREGRS